MAGDERLGGFSSPRIAGRLSAVGRGWRINRDGAGTAGH